MIHTYELVTEVNSARPHPALSETGAGKDLSTILKEM